MPKSDLAPFAKFLFGKTHKKKFILLDEHTKQNTQPQLSNSFFVLGIPMNL